MTASAQSAKRQHSTARRSRLITPAEVQAVPRFALSARLQGGLLAEQILADFRKDLADSDPKPATRPRSARKPRN